MDLIKEIDKLAKDYMPIEEPIEESSATLHLRAMGDSQEQAEAKMKKHKEDNKTALKKAGKSIVGIMKKAREKAGWK